MASPQKENGYTAIANEILEALSHIRIPGEARQIMDVIFRKTYGFNKKEDSISLSQFCVSTGLKKPTVCKALMKLYVMNLITKKDNDVANIYRINKDFETWKPLPKKVTLPKKVIGVTQKGKNRYPKRYIQKTVTKDTITKDIVASDESFNFQEELLKLKDNKRKDFKIIAFYWKKKNWVFENREQFNAALTRELKAAKALKGYSGQQIGRAMAYCAKEYPIWSLESCFKRIQDLVNKKS